MPEEYERKTRERLEKAGYIRQEKLAERGWQLQCIPIGWGLMRWKFDGWRISYKGELREELYESPDAALTVIRLLANT